MKKSDVVSRSTALETPKVSHACEYETSMMLVVNGETVHPDEARPLPRQRTGCWVSGECQSLLPF